MVLRSIAFGMVLAGLAGAAQAQVSVFTGASQATACSQAAKAPGTHTGDIAICTVAIEHEALIGRDLAGTYVNRGVLYLRDQAYDLALADFNAALVIDAKMGEAYVNRGAALIALRRFSQGIADIDHGLELNPEEPEKAYYNRGLAKERMDDLKGAYLDYVKASELAPNWAPPQVELKRFSVQARKPT